MNLPHEGVVEHLNQFLVARDAQNRLVGCAGLEQYDRLALMRSVAVSPDIQRGGLGSTLVTSLLDEAMRSGVEEIMLLTTTAKDYFARRFGFKAAERADYNERLVNSAEWLLPRCSSASFMRLRLN